MACGGMAATFMLLSCQLAATSYHMYLIPACCARQTYFVHSCYLHWTALQHILKTCMFFKMSRLMQTRKERCLRGAPRQSMSAKRRRLNVERSTADDVSISTC